MKSGILSTKHSITAHSNVLNKSFKREFKVGCIIPPPLTIGPLINDNKNSVIKGAQMTYVTICQAFMISRRRAPSQEVTTTNAGLSVGTKHKVDIWELKFPMANLDRI